MRVRAAADNAFGPGTAIPPSLGRTDPRFLAVRPGRTSALESGWPTVAYYPHGHLTLALHLALGHPCGLVPAPGSPVIA